MDGRWSLCLAGGLLGGLIGCSGLQNRPPAVTPAGAEQAAKQAGQSPGFFARMTGTAKPPQAVPPAQVAVTPPPPTKLKPSTYVSIGTLKEQIALDANRPLPEREAARAQARQSYQKAIDIDPKYAPAYVAMGQSYVFSGERDRAEAMFQKAHTLAPKDASLWFEQGTGLARAKDLSGAAECLTKAAALDPANKQYSKYLGLTLARLGKYEESLQWLAKSGGEAEARYTLARMMQHNQQAEAAAQQLQFALQADPSYEPARQLLAQMTQGGDAGDTGVRTVGHEEPDVTLPAMTPSAGAPANAAAPQQLAPVRFGDGGTP